MMNMRTTMFAALAMLALYACDSKSRDVAETGGNNQDVNTAQETPVKMIEYLVGEWQRDPGAASAGNNQFENLTFTEEARFIARSNNQVTDSGAFRMNEQLRSLYLESDADKQTSEFEIDIQENTMTLKPKRTQPGQENTSFTFRRIGQPAISGEKRGAQ